MSAGAQPLPLPLTPKGARTRQRILDTAERLFAEKGFNGTTLRDVAGASGLRIPSLYNHFPSKESLYEAVLEQGIAPLLEALSEYLAAGDQRPDRRSFTRHIFGLLAQRPELPRLVQHEVLDGGRHLSPILSGWFKPALAKAEEAIRALPGARRWEPDQIPLLVMALYHMAVGAFSVGPLYEALDREDLMAENALEMQTRFFAEVVEALLPEN
jgi:TetR/AcrR family transcriptional regulator